MKLRDRIAVGPGTSKDGQDAPKCSAWFRQRNLSGVEPVIYSLTISENPEDPARGLFGVRK